MPPNTPNAPRGVSSYPSIDINRRMQEAMQGLGGHSGEDDYMLRARGQLTPQQYDQLQEARAQAPGAFTQLGRATGFLGTPAMPGLPGQAGDFQFQPVLPPTLQGKLEQLYSSGLDRLNQRFAPGAQSPIEPITNQARSDFFTRTAPSLANYYTAQGAGLGSSGRMGGLGAAGAGLETDLAALRANYGIQEQNQLMNLLNQRPYESVYMQGGGGGGGTPATEGWGLPVLQAGLETAADFIPGSSTFGRIARGLTNFGSRIAGNLTGRRSSAPAAQPMGAQAGNFIGNRPAGQGFSQPIELMPRAQQAQQPGAGGILTPQALAQLQAVAGGAASDFARTYKQPQGQQTRQNLYSRLFPELAQYAQSTGVR